MVAQTLPLVLEVLVAVGLGRLGIRRVKPYLALPTQAAVVVEMGDLLRHVLLVLVALA